MTRVTALMLSAALLLSGHSANAGQQFHSLTPAQAQRLSRDLLRSNSQDFFRQGQSTLEREVQILQRRRLSSNKPLLKIKEVPRYGDRIPTKN